MDSMFLPVDCLEMGSLIINREHYDLLDRLGLLDVDAIWNWEGGQRIKDIPGRRVLRFSVKHRGRQIHVYVKKHMGSGTGPGNCIYRSTAEGELSPGKKEFRNICSFREHGLGTVVPIAAGEREDPVHGRQSFILTQDFSPYVQLEALMEDNPAFFMGEAGVSRKRELLTEIAQLARSMHQAGFNHQDFNATHILLHYPNHSSTPSLVMFDLQRVETGRAWRFRWPIKSIARLNYTLPEGLFSQRDRARLWLDYMGKERLDFWGRLRWVWIQRKTQRIARHTQKILDRRRRSDERRSGGG